MRRLITPALIACALFAAGAVSSAVADEPVVAPPATTPGVTTPPRLLTVNGVSDATLLSDASKAQFISAYRAQLTAALADASSKATMLAAGEGVTLGAIQSITEQSATPAGNCDEPMFAEAKATAGPRAPIARRKAVKHHRTTTTKKRKLHVHARAASSTDGEDDVYPCDVSATVTVAYAIA
jgi:hypothetical protein